MHEMINKLAFALFKKNTIDECSVEEIEDLAKQYPYFSSAQLLLAAKQKKSGHPEFEKQLSAASLHVSNPLWLDHLLNSNSIEEKIVAEEKLSSTEVDEQPYNDEIVVERTSHRFVVASDDQETSVVEYTSVVESESESEPPPHPPPPHPVEPELPPPPPPPVKGAHVVQSSDNKEQPLVFEPYYTVDYFASQGIKNVVEEKPKDKFSQQLKSFTEWLKTIRQMPPQQIAALSDNKAEEKVVQLATHSIEDGNVDTEAMAEVWIKQGQPEKAVNIYRKLSLLNPSKSSYFASLIENLKKT